MLSKRQQYYRQYEKHRGTIGAEAQYRLLILGAYWLLCCWVQCGRSAGIDTHAFLESLLKSLLLSAATGDSRALRMSRVNNDTRTDAELVAAIQAGDESAGNALVARYRSRVREKALYRLRNLADAEDLTQDSMIILLNKITSGEIDDSTRIVGFLFSTVGNLISNHVSKAARRKTDTGVEDFENQFSSGSAPDDDIQRGQEAAAMKQALEELEPPHYREILYRYFLLQQSKELICSSCDITEKQFTNYLHRAKQKFAKHLGTPPGALV